MVIVWVKPTEITGFTWNFSFTQNSRLPSSGNEDVRRRVLPSIDLHGGLKVICESCLTLNSLDFSL